MKGVACMMCHRAGESAGFGNLPRLVRRQGSKDCQSNPWIACQMQGFAVKSMDWQSNPWIDSQINEFDHQNVYEFLTDNVQTVYVRVYMYNGR
jgi:hypothetical protein